MTREQLVARLKAERHAQRLSQQALADRAGLSQGVIGGYESGNRSVGLSSLIAVADALGYDVTLTKRETTEEPDWHKGCTWCWRTPWHRDPPAAPTKRETP